MRTRVSHQTNLVKLLTFGHISQRVCPARSVAPPYIAVMDGETQRAAAAWENGTLAPVDRLQSDRADSPTPGLVEGTEPGKQAGFCDQPEHVSCGWVSTVLPL